MAVRSLTKRLWFRRILTATQAATELQFFGAGKRGDSSFDGWDTNDTWGGRVPANTKAFILAIGWFLAPIFTAASQKDALKKLANAIFSLTVQDTVKVIDGELLAMWPAGVGVWCPTASADMAGNLGFPNLKMRMLPEPQDISGASYSVTEQLEAALAMTTATTADLYCTMLVKVEEEAKA